MRSTNNIRTALMRAIEALDELESGRLSEEGWLIEQPTLPPLWLVMPSGRGGGEWTTDAGKALRFARKQDAEAVMRQFLVDDVVATDHVWTVSHG